MGAQSSFTFKTPTLVEVSHEFGSIRLFILRFICWHCKISEVDHHFFLIFCIKLDSHKERKVTEPNFPKKVLTGQEGPKSFKNGSKMRF